MNDRPDSTESQLTNSASPRVDIVEAHIVDNQGVLTEKGQWLHPSSLVFEFAAGIRNQLFPAVLALFSASTGSWIGGIIALLFFVGTMVAMVLRYLRLRYRVTANELIVDDGVIYRVHRTIPVQRIQNIDLVQNVFHRLLGVAEVRVETASGTEPEAILRVLSLADFESLRARVFARKHTHELSSTTLHPTHSADNASVGSSDWASGGAEAPGVDRPSSLEHLLATSDNAGLRETLIKLSLKQLALAGIASNRGTILLFVGLGIVSQQASSSFRVWRFAIEDITPYFSGRADSLNWLWIVIAGLSGLLGVLLLVKTLSIAWYVLKFYDYTLDRSAEDLRVSCGLLTRVSATVRRDRIQLISIHRTLVGRWLKIASIRIESAGGGTDDDDPAATMARRWFMPVLSEAQIPIVMEQLSPGLRWDERAFDWQPLSSYATRRMRRFILLATGFIALVAAAFGAVSLVVAAFLLAVFGWWWSQRRVASMRYARNAGKILFRSGVFTKKCSLAFTDKVQSVTVSHSPFDRRWNMATLSVDTIASGPAEHRIAIPMLDIAFAHRERDVICRAASSMPVF